MFFNLFGPIKTQKVKPRVLFILRNRKSLWKVEGDSYGNYGNFPSGLYNSARLVCEMLVNNGIESKLVDVIDDNCINRVTTEYKPTHVIIEAIVVVPAKFIILQKLHPTVKWITRNHSEIPFVSGEGNAIDWMLEYVKHPNVIISSNTIETNNSFKELVKTENPSWGKNHIDQKIVYLPNYYYPTNDYIKFSNSDCINISCFGAIRPLKNNLIQAVAAITYANQIGKKLNFHINGGRVEGGASPVLKNLRLLFKHTPNHQLIEHDWKNHDCFMGLVKEMDIVTQCSFSESFCIIAADGVSAGVPILVSPEVKWASFLNKVNPTSIESMVKGLKLVHNNRLIVMVNKWLLKWNAYKSKKVWLSYLNN